MVWRPGVTKLAIFLPGMIKAVNSPLSRVEVTLTTYPTVVPGDRPGMASFAVASLVRVAEGNQQPFLG